jgi:homoserine kinase
MEKVKIFAPATVANVSCAFDVLGFPLEETGDFMTFLKTDAKGVKIKMLGNSTLPTEAEKNVAGVVAIAMLEKINSSFGVEIEIDKRIKPGSGIGSSAASAAGAAFGMNLILDEIFSQTELIEFAMLGEKLASGVAHADNVAPCITGGFALVRSYEPLDVIRIEAPENLYVTILHPQIEVKTSDSRKVLKKDLSLKTAVKQWGNIASLISSLHTSDYKLLGRSLEDIIIEPIRSVFIPLFYEVKHAAKEAKALGSGISGSGPSIFALSEGYKTALKTGEAMSKVYSTSGIDFDIHVSKIASKGCRIVEN